MKEIVHDGIVYYVGENAKDNWDIIHKAKNENADWVWFHLSNLPSAHVIICKTLESMKKDKDWKYNKFHAAQLIVDHSKFKNVPKLKVMCAKVKDVSTKTEKEGSVIVKKTVDTFLLK